MSINSLESSRKNLLATHSSESTAKDKMFINNLNLNTMARQSTNNNEANLIYVTVLDTGKSPIAQELDVTGGEEYSVADVLEMALGEVPVTTVRIRGEEFGLDAIVEDKDRIVITRNVKGGK